MMKILIDMNLSPRWTEVFDVYLFGSYADGYERISSDVDLAILFDSRDRETVNQ